MHLLLDALLPFPLHLIFVSHKRQPYLIFSQLLTDPSHLTIVFLLHATLLLQV